MKKTLLPLLAASAFTLCACGPQKSITKDQFLAECAKFTTVQIPETLKIEATEIAEGVTVTASAVIRFGHLDIKEADPFTLVSGDEEVAEEYADMYVMLNMHFVGLMLQEEEGEDMPSGIEFFANPYALKISETGDGSTVVMAYEWDNKGGLTKLSEEFVEEGAVAASLTITYTPSGSYTTYADLYMGD